MGSGDFGGGQGELRVPDLAEPIEAWRVWNIGRFRGSWALTSTKVACARKSRSWGVSWSENHRAYWPRSGTVARCLCALLPSPRSSRELPERANLPHAECPCAPPPGGLGYFGFGCGIYAMKTRRGLLDSNWVVGGHVLGRVHLGGRVWEHEGGYRAQYARVTALDTLLSDAAYTYVFSDLRRITRELARNYGVPLSDEMRRL